MRTAFIQQLTVEARRDPRIFLLVADLGFSVVEAFAQEFPDRYLNVGVAEQNMAGVAAGLASEGYHVFTYSIANFPTLRCLEQIRNDICYHGLSVTTVAVGGGMAYGNLGYSHHAVQDLAIMRTLPGIRIFAPADPGETRECLQWLAGNPGPAFIRLGKAGEPALHDVRGVMSGPLHVRKGVGPVALIAAGSILKVAIDVHDAMGRQGLAPNVFSMPVLKPVERDFLFPLAKFQILVTLEEHVAEGGLASVLRENLRLGPEVLSLHVGESGSHWVGTQEYLREKAGMDVAQVEALVCSLLKTPLGA